MGKVRKVVWGFLDELTMRIIGHMPNWSFSPYARFRIWFWRDAHGYCWEKRLRADGYRVTMYEATIRMKPHDQP